MGNKPKIALVLAGGGIRSFSLVPVIKFFIEHQIEISDIFACSGGAFLGCAYGISHTVAEWDNLVQLGRSLFDRNLFQVDKRKLFSLTLSRFVTSKPNVGIYKAEPWRNMLTRIFGDTRLEQTHPRVHIQTTDFRTGKGVLLSEGLIVDSLYASMADYPFLPPICINNQWLVDGAFSAPLPIIAASEHKPDIIISISYDSLPSTPSNNLIESFFFLLNRLRVNLKDAHLDSQKILPCKRVNIQFLFDQFIRMWDLHKLDMILDFAATSFESQKGGILKAIKEWHDQQNN